jgi:hypothetical protein
MTSCGSMPHSTSSAQPGHSYPTVQYYARITCRAASFETLAGVSVRGTRCRGRPARRGVGRQSRAGAAGRAAGPRTARSRPPRRRGRGLPTHPRPSHQRTRLGPHRRLGRGLPGSAGRYGTRQTGQAAGGSGAVPVGMCTGSPAAAGNRPGSTPCWPRPQRSSRPPW